MEKRVDSAKYAAFVLNDFICDEYFQSWVMHPNPESEAFWKEWLEQHPGKRHETEQARNLLTHIAFTEHWPADEKIQRSLAASLSDIAKEEEETVRRTTRVRYMRRILVAAALTGIVILAGTLFYRARNPQTISYATAFGKINKIYLPDSSFVVLNAHSSISYTPWKAGAPREVWLEGEAFFDVKHLAAKADAGQDETTGADGITADQRFLVQTKDLTVEVLGTAFDIRQRRGKIEIVLQQGKIRVSFKNTNQTPVIMNPGDLLAYDPLAARIVRSATTASDYTAWVDGKLQLPNPGVQQIAQYLEDNYGYKVILKDPALAQKSVEGPILFDNLEDALFVLSKVLNVDIVKKDSTLIFSPR